MPGSAHYVAVGLVGTVRSTGTAMISHITGSRHRTGRIALLLRKRLTRREDSTLCSAIMLNYDARPDLTTVCSDQWRDQQNQ
jgi:hypothetical protein